MMLVGGCSLAMNVVLVVLVWSVRVRGKGCEQKKQNTYFTACSGKDRGERKVTCSINIFIFRSLPASLELGLGERAW